MRAYANFGIKITGLLSTYFLENSRLFPVMQREGFNLVVSNVCFIYHETSLRVSPSQY